MMKASPAMPGHRRHAYPILLALLAAVVTRADGFTHPPYITKIAAPHLRRPPAGTQCGNPLMPHQRRPARGPAPLNFYQGGVLGVGTPEVLVIAAVGYFLLGPEELYRLSKEIGKIVGQARE